MTRTEYEGAPNVVQRMLSFTKFESPGVMIDELARFTCRQSSKVPICGCLDDSWAAAAWIDPHTQTKDKAEKDIEAMRGSIVIWVKYRVRYIVQWATVRLDFLSFVDDNNWKKKKCTVLGSCRMLTPVTGSRTPCPGPLHCSVTRGLEHREPEP